MRFFMELASYDTRADNDGLALTLKGLVEGQESQVHLTGMPAFSTLQSIMNSASASHVVSMAGQVLSIEGQGMDTSAEVLLGDALEIYRIRALAAHALSSLAPGAVPDNVLGFLSKTALWQPSHAMHAVLADLPANIPADVPEIFDTVVAHVPTVELVAPTPEPEAVVIADAEPVADAEPIADAEPVADAEPIADAEPVADVEVEAVVVSSVVLDTPEPSVFADDVATDSAEEISEPIATQGQLEEQAEMGGEDDDIPEGVLNDIDFEEYEGPVELETSVNALVVDAETKAVESVFEPKAIEPKDEVSTDVAVVSRAMEPDENVMQFGQRPDRFRQSAEVAIAPATTTVVPVTTALTAAGALEAALFNRAISVEAPEPVALNQEPSAAPSPVSSALGEALVVPVKLPSFMRRRG